ncbi:MAG TPA: hypothetical protein VGN08_11750 [Solirubrobacteraceae bacterium]|jgi:hypothetical protein
MVLQVSGSSIARRAAGCALAGLALLLSLAACGAGAGGGSSAHASAADPHMSCPELVLDTLGRVVRRVYREGVASERTGAARHLIAGSIPLREAVQAGDSAAATAAAKALVAGGHMTNLRVVQGTRVLADVGVPAVAPLRGTIRGAHGTPIASYVSSVWADEGFIAESDGIGQGLIALRARGRSIGGSLPIHPGPLPQAGTLSYQHVRYQYTSFGGTAYPAGALRIYLLKPVSSTAAFCGRTSEDTVVSVLSREASLIYAGEAGRRTLPQVRRVQGDPALLDAVARSDPAATRLAVEALLNQHIVRLRVSARGRLLADVGGPYVLAPVRAALTLGGRTIGSFVLSIQDDEGYLRLTKRLAGLSVLMYMNDRGGHPVLVKNSLGPEPGSVPDSGSYSYRGRSFRVFTIHAHAFPSGPLRINVLIPIPYT